MNPVDLLTSIGYDINKGWKWKDVSTHSQKLLILYVHQSADAMFNKLTQLDEECMLQQVEENQPKRRRL
jgi:hypothetical protein